MADWPGHTFEPAKSKSDAEGNSGETAASTLEQLKGAGGGDGGKGGDGGSPTCDAFTDDFVGTDVSESGQEFSKCAEESGQHHLESSVIEGVLPEVVSRMRSHLTFQAGRF